MEMTKWDLLFGISVFFAVALVGIFIYGIVSKDLVGSNFYLFKSSLGDIIVGSISLLGGVFFAGVGIWYYIAHKEHFFDRHQSIHEYHVKSKTQFLGSSENAYVLNKTYDAVLRELKLKSICILTLSLIFSFYFIFLGASCFINEESVPSIYQAYRRPCPDGTVSAGDQKSANELTANGTKTTY